MTPLVREMVSHGGNVADKFMWFDMGFIKEFVNFDEGEYTQLPFDQCAICGYGINSMANKHLFLLVRRGDVVAVGGWIITGTKLSKIPDFAITNTEDGALAALPSAKEMNLDVLSGVLAIIWEFMQSLDTSKTAYRPIIKHRSPTNMRRISKGKSPLIYDWHTVTIEPTTPKQDHKGGTHATPRRHQCRGHWRNCKSGKRVWVKDCWKGDASKGSVFKDYKVQLKNEGAT